jgi:hypothetical protein
MRDNGDDGYARDYAKSEVCQGEALSAYHGFGNAAKHPEAHHICQQMQNPTMEEHVGK